MPIVLPILPLGSWFSSGSWPRLPCGACATGELQLGKPDEIDVAARYRDHPGWDPDWSHGHFSVRGECSDRKCRSIALLAGKMKVDAALGAWDEWNGGYDTFYELRYCEPPLRLFPVPHGTSDEVKRAIESVSQVIWVSPPSAANRLRAAIDLLLTDLGVLEGGKTHDRILRLLGMSPEVATVLEAVKWIGNEGSHMAALPLEDVLEGVALLERALTLVYDSSAADLDRRAREINAGRGTRRATAPPARATDK